MMTKFKKIKLKNIVYVPDAELETLRAVFLGAGQRPASLLVGVDTRTSQAGPISRNADAVTSSHSWGQCFKSLGYLQFYTTLANILWSVEGGTA